MRLGRIKFIGGGYYHLICRIVDGTFRIIDDELNKFVELMRKVEDFSGVVILDYAIMSNHVHLIVFASGVCLASEEEIIRRFEALYGPDETRELKARWKLFRETGCESLVEEEKDGLRKRMEDISEFMKTLKQRYTMGYNKRHHRKGTLWEGRFQSILVDPKSLPILSAYIDLNPVRANLADDPKDYLYSGYGAAMGGNKKAREGLKKVYEYYSDVMDWAKILEEHRMIIYGYGGKNGIHPAIFNREQVEKVLNAGGKLSLFELLRCRVRYFISGFVIGTRKFVEEQFRDHPKSFGPKRKTGARKFRWYGGELGELYVARDLRKDVIRPMEA